MDGPTTIWYTPVPHGFAHHSREIISESFCKLCLNPTVTIVQYPCNQGLTYSHHDQMNPFLLVLLPAFLVVVVKSSSFSHSITGLNGLFSTLIKDGDLIYNVNSNSAPLFQLLADLTGSSGSIIGISKSTESFEILKSTATTHNIWDKSLILHADPGAHIYRTHSSVGDSSSDSVNTVDDVHQHIGGICPKLIHINHESSNDAFSVINALMGSIEVITQCAPVLLLTTSFPSSSCPVVVSSLEALKYGVKFLINTCSESQCMNSDSEQSLLAFPHSNEHMSLVESLHPFVSSGQLVDVSASMMSLCQEQNQHNHHHKQQTSPQSKSMALEAYSSAFTVESDMLIRHGRYAGVVDNTQCVANGVTNTCSLSQPSSTNIMTTGPTFTYDSSLHIQTSNQIADGVCIIWAHSLALQNATQSVKVYKSCVSFAKQRFHMIRTMLKRRQIKRGGGSNNQNAASMNGERMHTHYIAANITSTVFTTSTELIQRSLISDTFDRPTPFEIQMNNEHCAEPVWCAHTVEMQKRLLAWQFPGEIISGGQDDGNHNEMNGGEKGGKPTKGDGAGTQAREHCTNAKFLVYEPLSDVHGIGSMLQMTVAAFRYAICLDRIFILSPKSLTNGTFTKWRHPGCEGTTTFECYFEPVSSCSLSISESDVDAALKRQNGSTFSTDGFKFDSYPLRNERILVLHGIPVYGPCAICQSEWPATSRFWDGLYTGGELLPHIKLDQDLQHSRAFMGTMKFTYGSQLLRFLLRPRPWFQEAIREIVQLSMISPTVKSGKSAKYGENTDGNNDSGNGGGLYSDQLLHSEQFPHTFSSLHVRFGMKAAEVELRPLTRYITILSYKMPFVRDIFVSTETQDVIQTLIREYPDYRFHYLDYTRHEYIDLQATENTVAMIEKEENGEDDENTKNESDQEPTQQGRVLPGRIDFVSEWMYSMANLYVGSEAKGGFLGSLSSNWCNLIHLLERTRGDGGSDYWSVDGGSAYTSCY